MSVSGRLSVGLELQVIRGDASLRRLPSRHSGSLATSMLSAGTLTRLSSAPMPAQCLPPYHISYPCSSQSHSPSVDLMSYVYSLLIVLPCPLSTHQASDLPRYAVAI